MKAPTTLVTSAVTPGPAVSTATAISDFSCSSSGSTWLLISARTSASIFAASASASAEGALLELGLGFGFQVAELGADLGFDGGMVSWKTWRCLSVGAADG